MTLTALAPSELPELEEFFRRLPLPMPSENLRQFSAPRSAPDGHEVVTLVMREAGAIVGTVGWVDVPLRVNDDRGDRLDDPRLRRVRWPVNLYLRSEQRGRGLGKKLMEATREGAAVRAVIGGNQASMPVLDRTGWRVTDSLICARWARPCLRLSRLADRLLDGPRREPPASCEWKLAGMPVRALRVTRLSGALPWASPEARGEAGEAATPRDPAYLDFAFGGPLRPWHSLHEVTVSGALAGCFALAARAERRGRLTVEIVDLEAVAGRERPVLEAARRTALACADVARLRILGRRFTGLLAGRATADHPLRISCDEDLAPALGGWKLTYGDHDQYRVRAASRPWRRGPEPYAVSPPSGGASR